jgi:hypothetical protein
MARGHAAAPDLTNQRFGKLVVLARAPCGTGRVPTRAYWQCRCDCGIEAVKMGKINAEK